MSALVEADEGSSRIWFDFPVITAANWAIAKKMQVFPWEVTGFLLGK